jgi:hypothetical protein
MQQNNPSSNVQYLRDVHGRNITGALVDGYLRKIVQGSRHMLRSPRGWAIDAHALATARAAGAVGVRVEDTESGRVYLATWAALDAHGYTFDRGHGRQIALPLRYWQLDGAPQQAALFA